MSAVSTTLVGFPGRQAYPLLAVDGGLALTLAAVVASLVIGGWVYVDASERFGEDPALLLAAAVGGLLLAGSFPGLVALAVADDPVVQGFPTALRIVPGLAAVAVYFYAR